MDERIELPRTQQDAALKPRSGDDAPLRLWLLVALLATFLLTQSVPSLRPVPSHVNAVAALPPAAPMARAATPAATPSRGAIRHADFGRERA